MGKARQLNRVIKGACLHCHGKASECCLRRPAMSLNVQRRTDRTGLTVSYRERKMRTNFFCTNFLNTPRGPGHPCKSPGTSQIPLFEAQGRQTFEGEQQVFGHHPFAWKTPTPLGGLRTQKVNLCALFSCLILVPHPLQKRIRGNL